MAFPIATDEKKQNAQKKKYGIKCKCATRVNYKRKKEKHTLTHRQALMKCVRVGYKYGNKISPWTHKDTH